MTDTPVIQPLTEQERVPPPMEFYEALNEYRRQAAKQRKDFGSFDRARINLQDLFDRLHFAYTDSERRLREAEAKTRNSYVRNCYLKPRPGEQPFNSEDAHVQLDGYAIIPLEDLPDSFVRERWMIEWLPKAIARATRSASGETGGADV